MNAHDAGRVEGYFGIFIKFAGKSQPGRIWNDPNSLARDDPSLRVRAAACFFLRNEIALCYTIASTAREVDGRGPCPETQCPGGVRGVSFHRRNSARHILKETTKKIFPPNCRSRMKTATRFRHRREFLSGVRISGNRNRSSAVVKAARFRTSTDY